MRDATLSHYPASYSEVCDTFRPVSLGKTNRLGRERFIHFLVPSPAPSLIAEHVVGRTTSLHREQTSPGRVLASPAAFTLRPQQSNSRTMRVESLW